MKLKFNPGAKVFAKVRGYPPWPARIEGCADENPNKMKYHVYFYGTGETAVVKSVDVFDFVENKNKFGKLKKHKNFTEAMQQIESELSPDQKAALATIDSDNASANFSLKESKDSPAELAKDTPTDKEPNKVTSPESSPEQPLTPGPTTIRRTSVSSKTPKPTTPIPQRPAKRKPEGDFSTLEQQLKFISTATASTPAAETEMQLSKSSDVHSRSGRKIKPKKYPDWENDNTDDPKEMTRDTKKSSSRSKSVKDADEDSNSGDWYLLATKKNDEEIKIPIKLNRPHFEDNQPRSITVGGWENLIFDEARALQKRIESGLVDYSEIEATDYMDRFTKVHSANVHILRTPDEEYAYRCQIFQTELNMLEIDFNIRKALTLRGADTAVCLEQLSKLETLNVTALMLKKHPCVLLNLKQLRKYVGNTNCWNMNESAISTFNVDATRIRTKADEIANNFKTLFFQEDISKSFWDHFSTEIGQFRLKTELMPIDAIYSLVTEPY